MFLVDDPSPDDYLRDILAREAVDDSAQSTFRLLESEVEQVVSAWGGRHLLEIYPTGAFEKGLANQSGIGIDFMLSLSPRTPFTAHEVFFSLHAALVREGFEPVVRNVTLSIVLGGIPVDLLPAKRESMSTDVHELYSARTRSGVKSNLTHHVLDALESGRREEIRLLKLWRDQNGLDFPSFYLELAIYAALRRRPYGTLADNVWAVLGYLETLFPARGMLDPSNANNIISAELTMAEKRAISEAATAARRGKPWSQIVG